MTKLKLMLATAMVVGLSLAFAGSALAADAGCGQCHGAYINNTNGTKTLMPGVSTLEDTKTPQAGDICNDQGRGLHGVHMNYSSATYGKKGTTRGNCNYCHNEHIHENAYVEFEGYMPSEALGTIASSSAATLNAGGTGYAVGDIASINGGTGGAVTVSAVSSGVVTAITVSSYRESHGYSVATGVGTTNVVGTGTGLTVNITSITNYGLRQTVDSKNLAVSGTGIGVNGLDITLMNGVATCTGACHSGTSATNPAAWGNYTSASISLSCSSCHDDVVNQGLSGAHASHFGTVISTGGTAMGAAGNAGCVNCHPDNRNDLWSQGRADNATKKAYPHASDGTNVVADNATINAGIGATKAGASTTCTNACHTNTSTAMWGDASLACDACHYYNATPTAAGNDAAIVTLGGGHSTHFGQNVLCESCHTVPGAGNTSHATALPVAAANATVLASLNYSAGTCSNTGSSCHGVGNTTPVWGTSGLGCAACHSYPGVAGRDWTTANSGHLARASVLQTATTAVVRKSLKHLNVASAYNAASDTYAGVTGDVRMCGKCHAGATHRNGTVNVADSNSLGQCSTTSFTYNNISGVGSVNRKVNCSNVSCHFGKTTPNWF